MSAAAKFQQNRFSSSIPSNLLVRAPSPSSFDKSLLRLPCFFLRNDHGMGQRWGGKKLWGG
jgi:hypothetical protein